MNKDTYFNPSLGYDLYTQRLIAFNDIPAGNVIMRGIVLYSSSKVLYRAKPPNDDEEGKEEEEEIGTDQLVKWISEGKSQEEILERLMNTRPKQKTRIAPSLLDDAGYVLMTDATLLDINTKFAMPRKSFSTMETDPFEEIIVSMPITVEPDPERVILRDDTLKMLNSKEIATFLTLMSNALVFRETGDRHFMVRGLSFFDHSYAPNCSYSTYWDDLPREFSSSEVCTVISARDLKKGEVLSIRKNGPLLSSVASRKKIERLNGVRPKYTNDDLAIFPNLKLLEDIRQLGKNPSESLGAWAQIYKRWLRQATGKYGSINSLETGLLFLNDYTMYRIASTNNKMMMYLTINKYNNLIGLPGKPRLAALNQYNWMTILALLKTSKYVALESMKLENLVASMDVDIILNYAFESGKLTNIQKQKQQSDRKSPKKRIRQRAEREFNIKQYVLDLSRRGNVLAYLFRFLFAEFFRSVKNIKHEYDRESDIANTVYYELLETVQQHNTVYQILEKIKI